MDRSKLATVRGHMDPKQSLVRATNADGEMEEITLEQYIRRIVKEETTTRVSPLFVNGSIPTQQSGTPPSH